MEEPTARTSLEYVPTILQKTQRGSTTFTQITTNESFVKNGRSDMDSISSLHSLVLNSKQPSATVFIAQPERPASALSDTSTTNGPHVVTIRINTDTEKPKAPKISSVHLKSDADFETFKISETRKNNSLVRINVDDRPKILDNEESGKMDKAPYIFCNSYVNSNSMMSSGQCSPSDTLDSGTCSDLDGTPPPLPKKKTTKTSKKVTVTMISSTRNELDFEDNESNISCDSLNSSELNGSVHADENQSEDSGIKESKEKSIDSELPIAPQLATFAAKDDKDGFLPQGLLKDIRDRSAKLNAAETESEAERTPEQTVRNTNDDANSSDESERLTSFRLVSQLNAELVNSANSSVNSKSPLVIETYEERKITENKMKQERVYSSDYFDADKFYDFHLNEKQFDVPVNNASVNKSVSEEPPELEYFAGVKDYKSEEPPSTIRSSKGTIRGVKNRVRAGIATFLQMQSTTKSYKEKDAGKVVLYTTTMGIVRSTYQRCVLVKKILRNSLVKYEERDVFMSTEYQDEIRDRMKSDQILVPQLFIDGHHIGDAETVEKLNECGELRKMLKPYKSPDACNTCQMCGGFRLLPCRICNGSKKSLHRNHFTAEFVALKCMNCDEVGLVRCEACS